MTLTDVKTTILFIFVVNFYISDVICICCHRVEKISYVPAPGTNCYNISGAYKNNWGNCVYETCADLLDHQDRRYCGKGSCNLFGCNCDDGCIQPDHWSKSVVSWLERKHGSSVYLQDIFFIKYAHLIDLEISKLDNQDSLKVPSKVPIGDK